MRNDWFRMTVGEPCPEVHQTNEISVRRTSKNYGFCNGCTDHGAYKVINRINFRGLEVRLCGACSEDLIKKIKAAV